MDIWGWIGVIGGIAPIVLAIVALVNFFKKKSSETKNVQSVRTGDNSPNSTIINSGRDAHVNINQSNVASEDVKQLQEQLDEIQEQTNKTFAGVKTLLGGKQSQKNQGQDGLANEWKDILDQDSFVRQLLIMVDEPLIGTLQSDSVKRQINQAKEKWLNDCKNNLAEINKSKEDWKKNFSLFRTVFVSLNEKKEFFKSSFNQLLEGIQEEKKVLEKSGDASSKKMALFDFAEIVIGCLYASGEEVASVAENLDKIFLTADVVLEKVSSAAESFVQKVATTDDILANNRQLSVDWAEFQQLQKDLEKENAMVNAALKEFGRSGEEMKKFEQISNALNNFLLTEGDL